MSYINQAVGQKLYAKIMMANMFKAPVARCCNKRRDNIAIPIADGHNFFPFKMLMSTVTNVVTAFLCCRGRAVSMKHR